MVILDFILDLFYAFCSLIKSNLNFSGPRHRQRFLCEVRVDTITYVGAGNSTTKKEAQMNASKDFVNFLVRSGQIDASEVPEDTRAPVKTEEDDMGGNGDVQQQNSGHQQQRSVFQVGVFLIWLMLWNY